MKVLNFGSLNLDYVYTVDHFVRPGETITSDGLEIFCGGKGLNQSVALARAGAEVYHAGKIGPEGRTLTDMLRTSGADTQFVQVTDGISGHAIIQLDRSGQNCILLSGGANHRIDEAFADGVLGHFTAGDILLTQNEITSVAHIMRAAAQRGMRIAFNPSPMDQKIEGYPLELVSWFILNEVEGKDLTGEEEPEKIAGKLLERFPSSAVVLTLGRDGVLYQDGNTACRQGIYQVERVDTTGAGDTFTGYFLASIAAGVEIPEALRRASVASSIAVSRKGAAPSIPTLGEVLEANLLPV